MFQKYLQSNKFEKFYMQKLYHDPELQSYRNSILNIICASNRKILQNVTPGLQLQLMNKIRT